VEKSSPKMWAFFVIFKTLSRVKQSRIGKKIAQSGHPGLDLASIPKALVLYFYINRERYAFCYRYQYIALCSENARLGTEL
jgi:hypothetical protein